MFISGIRNLRPLQRYGAVSLLAIMTASCASYARDGQYQGDSVQYPPPRAYNSPYPNSRDAATAAYNPIGGIDAARAAHRNHSPDRAEQLDGDCESRVSLNYGETLSDIAEFCDVSIATILNINPQIRNQNFVSVGETVLIPSGRSNVYANSRPVDRLEPVHYQNHGLQEGARKSDHDYYVVERGDTLARIAQRYNVSLNDIARLNPNLQPRQLAIGERIYLPGRAVYASTISGSRHQAASYGNSSPNISITPARGPRDGEVRLVGDNFQSGEQVYILYGDSRDTLIRIRTIKSDGDGRIDERVTLPVTYDRDLAYFAVQHGSNTYMSPSYSVVRTALQTDQDQNSGLFFGGGNKNYSGPLPLTDQASLIAVDQDVYRGDSVTLVAHSFPPNTPISIYVGPNRNALIKIAETRTGAEGVFQTQVSIPDTINSDSVYFVAAIEDGARTYFSERVRFRTDGERRDGERYSPTSRAPAVNQTGIPYRTSTMAAPSSRSLDRGNTSQVGNGSVFSRVRQNIGRDDVSINSGGESAISGVLTNEGVSCPTLRDDAGRIYTLLGDLQGFDDGDRVLISGSAAADRRICGQSETIQVFSIAKAPW